MNMGKVFLGRKGDVAIGAGYLFFLLGVGKFIDNLVG